MLLVANLINRTGWKPAVEIFFCSLSSILLISGCKVTTVTTVEPFPIQRKEVAPLIEQRVQQYIDSARVLSITGGTKDEEDIYVIAVKNGAGKAKDLILKK